MKMTKAMASVVVGLGLTSFACSQQPTALDAAKFSFASSGDRQMWHTVLIVSAAVGIIGILDSDSTLTVIGGAGVLLSLYESESSHFAFHAFRPGGDFFRMGPMSLGFDGLVRSGFSQRFDSPRPTAHVVYTFKF